VIWPDAGEALGVECPACKGTGRASAAMVVLPDFREAGLPQLTRAKARQLKDLVKLGWELNATEVELAESARPDGLAYKLTREGVVLLHGVFVDAVKPSRLN
jgi:hypothetical protein